MDWTINWEKATEEEKAAYEEAVNYYVPIKPGYVWDCGWEVIHGYQHVMLYHIAELAEDLWSNHASRKVHDVPCPQDRKNKPKGKWRKRKRRKIYGEGQYCFFATEETGRKVITRNHGI